MDNQNAMNLFNKIDNIRKAIHEAQMEAFDQGRWDVAVEIDRMRTKNNAIWEQEIDNAYSTVNEAAAEAIERVRA